MDLLIPVEKPRLKKKRRCTSPESTRSIATAVSSSSRSSSRVSPESSFSTRSAATAISSSYSSSCTTYSSSSSVPSLTHLCLTLISCKLERFPPAAFCSLSEDEWDCVITLRHTNTAPKNKVAPSSTASSSSSNNSKPNNKGGHDGSGRLLPAINYKVIQAIEEENPHLSRSNISDTLIWKDNVECFFKANSDVLRPPALRLPYPLLVQNIVDAGEELNTCYMDITDTVVDEDDVDVDEFAIIRGFEARMNSIYNTMCEAPMSVGLLNESKVGKTVTKFIKSCAKRERSGDMTNIERWMVSDVMGKFEGLLSHWMELASQNGVVVKKSRYAQSNGGGMDCSGRGKQTTDEQHYYDMRVLPKCTSWRKLFKALLKRKEMQREAFGESLRKKREMREDTRAKIKSVVTIQTRKRQDEILSGSKGSRALQKEAIKYRGVRCTLTGAAGTFVGGTGKMKMAAIRGETKGAMTARQKANRALLQKAPEGSMFGAAIANAGPGRRNGTVMFGNRKLKIPPAAAAAKKKSQTSMFAKLAKPRRR
mmetsp:Transcript_31805/g.46867  ORF Transcript_31805/g.46867 Transcript_31805/m.46867 type:complete len:537 (-) Transcript_31805:59-1669(-)